MILSVMTLIKLSKPFTRGVRLHFLTDILLDWLLANSANSHKPKSTTTCSRTTKRSQRLFRGIAECCSVKNRKGKDDEINFKPDHAAVSALLDCETV